MDGLTLEAVLQFLLSHGGRVPNSKLVHHFKDFLNHPLNKAANREKFKGIVNELAALKAEDGDKIVVLKKKYSQGLEHTGSAALLTTAAVNTEPMSSTSTPQSESEADFDSTDGGMMSKARVDENLAVTLRNSDRVPVSTKMSDDSSSMSSSTSLTSAGSQKSLASSPSAVASKDEDANTSIDSVKDKIRKLNKTASDSDLNRVKPGGGNKKSHKHAVGDDENSHDYNINLNPEQKHWLTVCASSDYQDMSRLLTRNPGLAKLKDLTNGYTGLHWAAKSGKGEVIKLLAKKPGVGVNERSHGGYTALHLAAMHGHEDVIDLLVQTYKADANLRDYSGKKPKQYLKNSKTQHLTLSRKHGADQGNAKVLGDSLARSSMRKSSRSKGVTSLVQAMTVPRQSLMNWSAMAGHFGDDEKDGGEKTQPESAESSLDSSKLNMPEEVILIPPTHDPSATAEDSTTGSQSSSQAVSTCSENVNEDNETTMIPETDPGVEEMTVDDSAK